MYNPLGDLGILLFFSYVLFIVTHPIPSMRPQIPLFLSLLSLRLDVHAFMARIDPCCVGHSGNVCRQWKPGCNSRRGATYEALYGFPQMQEAFHQSQESYTRPNPKFQRRAIYNEYLHRLAARGASAFADAGPQAEAEAEAKSIFTKMKDGIDHAVKKEEKGVKSAAHKV